MCPRHTKKQIRFEEKVVPVEISCVNGSPASPLSRVQTIAVARKSLRVCNGNILFYATRPSPHAEGLNRWRKPRVPGK